ncbi:MAG: hypothetical protein FJZ63_06725 [Chlamydiae bacterium]|nr:hypothetical protein [Chlamydiota bacterium]
MECNEIQSPTLEGAWFGLLDCRQALIDRSVWGVVKASLDSFANQYKDVTQQLLTVNWSEGAPYTQEQIEVIREAAQAAKEEANEHIKSSWEALGNYHAGTVIRESVEGFNSLRDSERLEREACHMENSNIAYENERK